MAAAAAPISRPSMRHRFDTSPDFPPPSRQFAPPGRASASQSWVRDKAHPPALNTAAGRASARQSWVRDKAHPPALNTAAGRASARQSWVRDQAHPPALNTAAGRASSSASWIRDKEEAYTDRAAAFKNPEKASPSPELVASKASPSASDLIVSEDSPSALAKKPSGFKRLEVFDKPAGRASSSASWICDKAISAASRDVQAKSPDLQSCPSVSSMPPPLKNLPEKALSPTFLSKKASPRSSRDVQAKSPDLQSCLSVSSMPPALKNLAEKALSPTFSSKKASPRLVVSKVSPSASNLVTFEASCSASDLVAPEVSPSPSSACAKRLSLPSAGPADKNGKKASNISWCFLEGLSETLYTWALLTAGLFSASSTLEDRQLECRQQTLWDSEILMFHAGFLAHTGGAKWENFMSWTLVLAQGELRTDDIVWRITASSYCDLRLGLEKGNSVQKGACNVFGKMLMSGWRSPSHALDVTIRHVCYHVSESVIHEVFAQFGQVDGVHIFGGSDHVFTQVVFHSKRDAADAFGELHGRNIYDGCCQMVINWGSSLEFLDTPDMSCRATIPSPKMLQASSTPTIAKECSMPDAVVAAADGLAIDIDPSDINIDMHATDAIVAATDGPTLDIDPSDINIAKRSMKFLDSDTGIPAPMDVQSTALTLTQPNTRTPKLFLPNMSLLLHENKSAQHVSNEMPPDSSHDASLEMPDDNKSAVHVSNEMPPNSSHDTSLEMPKEAKMVL
ncbi:hypothetical protein U9M48_043617 [Paspalum notatum var. saurae]|uniref:RRM domain-containing protein n=1 Tax=Paspalum notatum var. saurae TaxID=547442 RepID=A0AAQ3UXV0_PASNO